VEISANRKQLVFTFTLLLLLILSPLTGAEKKINGNTLLEVVPTTEKGKLSYNLIVSGDFTYRTFLLEQPERLVIDLTGVDLASSFSTDGLANGPVKGVRVSRFTENTVRVVFDLEYLIGYKLERSSAAPGGLWLEFNTVLKDVGFRSASVAPEIYVDTTGPVQYKTDYLLNPHRLIIDLWDVTLTSPALTIPGNDEWVKTIRVSQFDPQTIRLVLDIKEPRNCVVAVDDSTPGRLLIKTIPEVVAASWAQTSDGGQLVIKGTGSLAGEPLYDPKTGKLSITIPHTKLSTQLGAAVSGERFQLTATSPSTVQVELAIPQGSQYQIRWTQDRKELTVQVQKAPLSGVVVLLDPGHGGVDSGAISPRGLREKDLNLAVSVRLKQKLEALGAEVLLTREDDRYLWLYDRVAIANRVGGTVFLSIHANNHGNRQIHGLEIWYHPEREESMELATALSTAVLARTKQHFRGNMSSKDLVLPREAEMPTVIFEMGFISNQEEEKLLCTEEFQDKIAEGLSQGLLTYLKNSSSCSP
jgi:N-acetylmuramoyl-L-alanine amidase